MALTKEILSDKIEVIGKYKAVQCRDTTVIKEDGVEISRSGKRRVLHPSDCKANGTTDEGGFWTADGTYTHTDTDISGESAEIQGVCVAVWTDDVKAAWKTHLESVSG